MFDVKVTSLMASKMSDVRGISALDTKNPFLQSSIQFSFLYLHRGSDTDMSGIQVVKSRSFAKCSGLIFEWKQHRAIILT